MIYLNKKNIITSTVLGLVLTLLSATVSFADVTVTKAWEDGLTGNAAMTRALPEVSIQREAKYEQLLNMFYPVGTIVESVNSDFDPNEAWGGSWERITDRVLVGAGNSYSLGATGGSNTISHSHGTNSSRNGNLSAAIGSTNSNAGGLGFKAANELNVGLAGTATYTVYGGSWGSGGSFNHWTQVWGTTSSTSVDVRQPYLAVNMWKRVA